MTRLPLGITGLVGIGAAMIVVPNLQSQTLEGPPAEIAPSEDPGIS